MLSDEEAAKISYRSAKAPDLHALSDVNFVLNRRKPQLVFDMQAINAPMLQDTVNALMTFIEGFRDAPEFRGWDFPDRKLDIKDVPDGCRAQLVLKLKNLDQGEEIAKKLHDDQWINRQAEDCLIVDIRNFAAQSGYKARR